jgi:hypothetical protein
MAISLNTSVVCHATFASFIGRGSCTHNNNNNSMQLIFFFLILFLHQRVKKSTLSHVLCPDLSHHRDTHTIDWASAINASQSWILQPTSSDLHIAIYTGAGSLQAFLSEQPARGVTAIRRCDGFLRLRQLRHPWAIGSHLRKQLVSGTAEQIWGFDEQLLAHGSSVPPMMQEVKSWMSSKLGRLIIS